MSITLKSEKEFAKWSNSKRAFQAGNPYSKAQKYKSAVDITAGALSWRLIRKRES